MYMYAMIDITLYSPESIYTGYCIQQRTTISLKLVLLTFLQLCGENKVHRFNWCCVQAMSTEGTVTPDCRSLKDIYRCILLGQLAR